MKHKHYLLIVITFICIAPISLSAQYVFPDDGYVFEDSIIPRVDIEIEPTFLGFILNENNLESNTEYPATFYFTKGTEIDTVDNVGFRLRGNTSRASGKKSFKIAFNANIQGQKFKGLEKMNLNGEHNDPSIMRSKVCWELYTSMGIPGSRSNHVAFYINGEYKGLYLNVEHIDEQFLKRRFSSNDGNLYKCLYPADLAYLGDNSELYKSNFFGRRAYQLQTNKEADDYSDLSHFIDVLNNSTPDVFQCELEKVFDVDNYLKVIAMDVLVSNWDGPIVNQNNFYLYQIPHTGKFVYLPYDLDNTLGIGWGSTQWWNSDIYNWSDEWGDVERPIYEKIMAVPEYRNKVSYYFEQFTANFFNNAYLDPYLDEFKAKLKPFRQNDSYASLDYGWNPEAFEKSFDQGVGNHVSLGLKQYIDKRNTSVMEQLDLEDPLALLQYYNAHRANDSINFELKIDFPWDVGGTATLFYQNNEEEWKSQVMTSDNLSDFKSSVLHEGIGEMHYYFEVMNFAGTISFPNCDFESVPLGLSPGVHPVINEILASNKSGNQDEAGEFEDWIEIYNPGDETIDLSAYYLSDNPSNPGKWRLDQEFINADEYYTIWADEDGEQGAGHANFKLSKDGEFLGLYLLSDNVFFVIDSLTFPAQESDVSYGRLPNGSGDFQVLPNSSFALNNESQSSIVENISDENIDLYPNPTNGLITIVSKDGKVHFSAMSIFNSLGQKVFEGSYDSVSKISINLHKFSVLSGTYFIRLLDHEGGQTIRKVIFNP